MTISVLNYQIGKVQIFNDCPNDWETEEIEEFLYETLNMNSDEVYYMCSYVGDVEEYDYEEVKEGFE